MRNRKDGVVKLSKYDSEALCQGCGVQLKYKLPMTMTTWKMVLKVFVRDHNSKCRKGV